jgi:hypothetical protein
MEAISVHLVKDLTFRLRHHDRRAPVRSVQSAHILFMNDVKHPILKKSSQILKNEKSKTP